MSIVCVEDVDVEWVIRNGEVIGECFFGEIFGEYDLSCLVSDIIVSCDCDYIDIVSVRDGVCELKCCGVCGGFRS